MRSMMERGHTLTHTTRVHDGTSVVTQTKPLFMINSHTLTLLRPHWSGPLQECGLSWFQRSQNRFTLGLAAVPRCSDARACSGTSAR